MEAPLTLLAIGLVLLIIIGPILGIIAYSRVNRLEREKQQQNPPAQDLTARIYALEQRLLKLEKAGVAAPVAPPQPVESKPAVPPPPSPALSAPEPASPLAQQQHPALQAVPVQQPALRGFAPPPLHTSLPKDSPSADLETVIAGRWFNRIGIVALLIAVTYFLKLAFDNNWIGPSGRVAIGIVLGGFMMPWSAWLLRRGYSYFSEGIVALGEATLFVSVWAGCQYYHLTTKASASLE